MKLGGAVLAAALCAKRPDAIVPVHIPMAAYSNESCHGCRSFPSCVQARYSLGDKHRFGENGALPI
jgi:hypothetical protein